VRERGDLKARLSEFLSRRSPGILEFFNIYCVTIYRSDCISLLLTSPSKLYHIVLRHYRGDAASADLAFTIAFLSPLVQLLREPEIADTLLDLAKTSRDEEFLELVNKLNKGGKR
jgi:hypothetical protein